MQAILSKAGKDTLAMLMNTHWSQSVLLSIAICVLGIIICGYAGVMKERELSKDREVAINNKEYKFGLDIFVAIVSGALSACFAFGIDTGKDMANVSNNAWMAVHSNSGSFLFQNNVTYVVILWCGLTTNFIWCMLLNAPNKIFADYNNKKTPLIANYLFSALAGTTWFLQSFFYGMGESRLGNDASSWILHMAFIILIANTGGLFLKEWKGKPQTLITIITGHSNHYLSVLIVGYGNSIKV